MNIQFTPNALEDYRYWKEHDSAKVARIKKLLETISNEPSSGIDKPEPLLFDLSCYWSCRIDREHRLVYKVSVDNIIVISCRYHLKSEKDNSHRVEHEKKAPNFLSPPACLLPENYSAT